MKDSHKMRLQKNNIFIVIATAIVFYGIHISSITVGAIGLGLFAITLLSRHELKGRVKKEESRDKEGDSNGGK